MDTHLAHVMTGNRAYDIHDSRRMALYLLNNIMGGPGMTARLNLTLRERHALVYTVESSMASYSDTGVWAVYFGCDPAQTDRCMRLVRRELDRMADTQLSDRQLNAAKKTDKGTDRCGMRQPRELRHRLREEFPPLRMGEGRGKAFPQYRRRDTADDTAGRAGNVRSGADDDAHNKMTPCIYNYHVAHIGQQSTVPF